MIHPLRVTDAGDDFTVEGQGLFPYRDYRARSVDRRAPIDPGPLRLKRPSRIAGQVRHGIKGPSAAADRMPAGEARQCGAVAPQTAEQAEEVKRRFRDWPQTSRLAPQAR